jgi:uncharacterized protein (DUF2461 family)
MGWATDKKGLLVAETAERLRRKPRGFVYLHAKAKLEQEVRKLAWSVHEELQPVNMSGKGNDPWVEMVKIEAIGKRNT